MKNDHEPEYPNHFTIRVSLKDPDLVIHKPTSICNETYPHNIKNCKEVMETNKDMKTEVKQHPDFNQWLLTPEGLDCNHMASLKGQPYLQNRLFWAFDAGRNCVWDQYIKQKEELQRLKEENERLKLNQHTWLP